MDTPNLPPSRNPDVGRPTNNAPKAPAAKTRIAGSALVPDLAAHSSRSGGVLHEYLYWVGVTPSCPREHIDCAGINFPKVNENLVDDPMRTNKKQRVPVIGAIVRLTEDKIRRMRDKLPRLVIRFLDDKGQHEEPGTGQNIGDNFQRPRRGQIITIPTEDEVASARARGKASRQYVPQKNDAPAARFMFAQLCADQEKGSRGEVYPEPLEVTGLEWPDEIDGDSLLQ